MKNLFLCSSLLLATSFSTSVIADDFSGWRVGGGYSKSSLDITVSGFSGSVIDEGLGDGFRVEAGYDFNPFIGLSVSYDGNLDKWDGVDVGSSAIKVSADVGVTFPVSSAYLKPYFKLGYVHYKWSTPYVEYDDGDTVAGLGLRLEYSQFYTDLGVDFYTLNLYDFGSSGSTFDWSITQTALTLGYKF